MSGRQRSRRLTMSIEYYALHRKGQGMMFQCASRTIEGHEEKVTASFHNWRSSQPKGNDFTIEDYLKDISRVKITVEIVG